jgi:hypothetical protein
MGNFEGVQHAVLFDDLLGVLFMGETDGPYFSVSNNVYPEDKSCFTKNLSCGIAPQ